VARPLAQALQRVAVMNMREAWTVFRVGGVPVRIHFTWLFVAVYMTILLSGQYSSLAQAAGIQGVYLRLAPWAWGLLLTLALFACVLLHELAHVAVARRGGARIHAVTLMMLGGVSEIGDVERPRLERRMAAAGPLLSLTLAALFYGVFRLARGGPADLEFGLYYLAQVNLIIGAFNLLPALPMDGGRIFRSLLVGRFGRLRATQIAAGVGKVLAAALVVLGLAGGSWWLALIGLFIFIAGDAEYRSVQARAALRGLRVADLFSRKVAAVSEGASAAEAASAMLQAGSHLAVVLDAGGRPAGLVRAAELAEIPVRRREELPVAPLARPLAAVAAERDLPSVLRLLDEERLEAVAVVDDGGRLVGTLSRDDIARGLSLRELALGR
jgi:Zn-dependent protease/CBS domain-containing protein